MRDRLIDFLKDAKDKLIDLDLGGLADALIAAGAVLPKFKVGQEVWYIAKNEIHSSKVLAVELRQSEIYCTLEDEWGGEECEFFASWEQLKKNMVYECEVCEIEFEDEYNLILQQVRDEDGYCEALLCPHCEQAVERKVYA
jgi:hypothetical protein